MSALSKFITTSIIFSLFCFKFLGAAGLSVSKEISLADEAVSIVVRGGAPFQEFKISMCSKDIFGNLWESFASFKADDHGNVIVDCTSSIEGTYQGIDGMGLFWSMQNTDGGANRFKTDRSEVEYILHLWDENRRIDSMRIRRVRRSSWTQRIEIRENGIVGTLFLPVSDQKLPVIVILSGSDGGISESPAMLLANHGFATLALGYFRAEGLPSHLKNIPLEYFENVFQWIGEHPSLNSDKLALFGASRGGELSLLLGTVFPEKLKAICAIAPSSVVFGALAEEEDAWTWRQRPILPAVPVPPLCLSGKEGREPSFAVSTTPSFLEGMKDHHAYENAAIPVEKIAAALMVVCGGKDQMWPASMFAKQIHDRLKKHQSKIAFDLLEYPKAGHWISMPYTPRTGSEYFHPVAKLWVALGGSPYEDDVASRDAWAKLVSFFEKNLFDGEKKI